MSRVSVLWCPEDSISLVYVGTLHVISDLTRRLQVDEIKTHAPVSRGWKLQNNVGVLHETEEDSVSSNEL